MKKKEFVLCAVLFLMVFKMFGQPALPQTDEANVVVPIENLWSLVILVCAIYSTCKKK